MKNIIRLDLSAISPNGNKINYTFWCEYVPAIRFIHDAFWQQHQRNPTDLELYEALKKRQALHKVSPPDGYEIHLMPSNPLEVNR